MPDSVCGKVLSAVVEEKCAVFCPELVEEMLRVIVRPKFDNFAPRRLRLQVVAMLLSSGTIRTLGSIPARCRDPKDDHLLELALASRADFIVTGDADLLVLGQIVDTGIVSPAKFLGLIAGQA